jgi:hypothetical protein
MLPARRRRVKRREYCDRRTCLIPLTRAQQTGGTRMSLDFFANSIRVP